ncbi:MAG: ComEC/Rec2 family competence protein, partial [Lachnospiraceae bacterium]|nr:ComEC/Rec2 family competence protein [Lachnospiraceae bacterium]
MLQSKEDGGCLDAVYYVEGNVKAFRMAENEGNYDEEQYYRSQMVPAVIEPTSMRMIQRPRVGLREALYTLRKRTAQVYETYLPGEESGILAAMTLGEKRDLSKEAKNLFQDTGISHILAISGLHISLVGMLVFRRLRKRMSNLPAAIITTVAVLGYGMLTGSSVSTNRAVGMFLLLLIATVFGRSYDLLTALAIMSIVLLWQNPYAYQQIGFAFSFVAILGVVMVAQPMQQTYDSLCDFRWRTHHRMDHGKRFHKNAKEVVFSALIAGTGMQLVTIPLCAYFFFGFPTYVVCLNLLVLPVLGVLISTGLLAGFLGGLVGAIWGLQSWIAILFFPCHWILYFYEVLCDHTLNLPAARMIVGRPMWWQVLLYYGILLGVVWGIQLLVKQHLEPKWKRARHYRKKQVSRWVIRYVATLSLALLPCFAVISYSSKGFEIDMLSVGQGDGIYIQSPEGVDFFIDGGSSSKKQVGEYVIGPFLEYHGVNRIDYWFVTHPDEDHVNGLMELIGGDIQIR